MGCYKHGTNCKLTENVKRYMLVEAQSRWRYTHSVGTNGNQETFFTCLYPPTVQTRLPRDQRPTKPVNRLVAGRGGGGGGELSAIDILNTVENHTGMTAHSLRTSTRAKNNNTPTKTTTNVLFNDALNTFYLRLYDVRHMVKNHYYRESANPLPPHGLLFPISSKGSFICIIPQTE